MNFVVTQKPTRYSFVRNSIFTEDLLWKEILVYLMNTSDETPEINFIRDIEPLDFDPGMILEYLERLASDTKIISTGQNIVLAGAKQTVPSPDYFYFFGAPGGASAGDGAGSTSDDGISLILEDACNGLVLTNLCNPAGLLGN